VGAMDLTICPECAELAEIQWRDVMESTAGPVEHAKILCVNRHWFLLPITALVRGAEAVPAETFAADRVRGRGGS
jgi:hypothetical protein